MNYFSHNYFPLVSTYTACHFILYTHKQYPSMALFPKQPEPVSIQRQRQSPLLPQLLLRTAQQQLHEFLLPETQELSDICLTKDTLFCQSEAVIGYNPNPKSKTIWVNYSVRDSDKLWHQC